MDVGSQAEVPTGAGGKQPAGEVKRDTVDIDPHQLSQPYIPVGHQCQRRQEMLAELAIGDPWLPFLIHLERERIDQNRFTIEELDIIGAGILERHAGLDGPPLDREGCQGCIFQLAERPFIGIGYEWD